MLVYDYKGYHEFDAVFFSEDKIVVHPELKSPFINFKEGLETLPYGIREVFLDQKLLFVELETLDQNCILDIYPAKFFLREISDANLAQMLRAIQWLTWSRKNCFCVKCGNSLNLVNGALEKKCVSCNLSFFPNLSPAIMVLIKKGKQILLARSPHFKKDMYSALAGFVEIGETAECAVHREVAEEVGLKIKLLKYFGSQSWPFPSSFMIAFTAEYLDGEIMVDKNEIEDAKWFDIDKLPDLPSMPSISRQLIEHVVKGAENCPN